MSDNTSWSIYQWVNAEIERLGRFRSFWEAGRKEDPDMFPDTMAPGDWDDQYGCFVDDGDGKAIDD